jgi:hypothetical protein
MKALLAGAAVAAAAGVMMGSAMHPSLVTDDRPEGPQIFAQDGGSTGPFDSGKALASYGDRVPDYVLGTDAKKAMTGPDIQPVIADDTREIVPQVADDATSPDATPEQHPALTRAAYAEPAPITVVYPSIDGGQAYAADAATSSDDSAPPADH